MTHKTKKVHLKGAISACAFFVMLFATANDDVGAVSAGQVSGAGCFARWDARTVTIGNECFSRVCRATSNGLRTVSFKTAEGAELIGASEDKDDATLTVTSEVDRSSPVGAECLVVRVRIREDETVFRLFAGATGPMVLRSRQIDALDFGSEPIDYKELCKWRHEKAKRLAGRADRLPFKSKHPKVSVIELSDRTDVADELVHEREWLLSTCEHPWFLSSAVLDVRDLETGDGLVLLRMAPMPESRPQAGDDYILEGNPVRSVTPVDNGYPVAELAYRGGERGRTRVLHAFQRCLRQYRPGRDGVFLTNTWGDGNRDARINEEFLMKEIAAGAKLGVDVIQIDDGWQKGRSANSAAVRQRKGAWGKYWDEDPDFWKPCPERFPHGLGPVVAAARERGLRFGLWFGPDSSNDFRHWEDDAACLLGYFRNYGIEYFKIDSVTIRSGLALERQERMFDRMLSESKGAMTFDLDCTASIRPGYLGLAEIGPLFVENRYIRKGDYRLWHPEHTLRNLWSLSRVIDPVRLRIEVLNPLRLPELYGDDILAPKHWPLDAPFAIAMCASPLGWFEISNLAPETVAAMKPLVARWKKERVNVHGGVTHPVGACPDGFSWTGFLTEAADGRGGYALLFREKAEESSFSLEFADCFAATGCEVIGGRGSASVSDGRLTVEVPRELDFVWVRLR